MIFRSSLIRELATSAAAPFLVLLGISITTQLVRLLGQAASGQITSTGVVALLGFTLVGYLPILLSVTLFIAVLMPFTWTCILAQNITSPARQDFSWTSQQVFLLLA